VPSSDLAASSSPRQEKPDRRHPLAGTAQLQLGRLLAWVPEADGPGQVARAGGQQPQPARPGQAVDAAEVAGQDASFPVVLHVHNRILWSIDPDARVRLSSHARQLTPARVPVEHGPVAGSCHPSPTQTTLLSRSLPPGCVRRETRPTQIGRHAPGPP